MTQKEDLRSYISEQCQLRTIKELEKAGYTLVKKDDDGYVSVMNPKKNNIIRIDPLGNYNS